MIPMMITITLYVDVEALNEEAAEEVLRQMDDAELRELAHVVDYEYSEVA